MRFSFNEKKDLFFSGILLSLAFGILLSGGYIAFLNFDQGFVVVFFVAFLTAGLGFLLHEIAHKYVADRYGLRTEFKAFYGWIWLSVLMSLFGFIIAAPGAVFIYGNMNRERNGKISLAGPMTNIILAVLFMIGLLIFSGEGIIRLILDYGFRINALLAVFNMVPVMPFDGGKVIAWSKPVFYTTGLIAFGLFVASWFI